MLNTPPSCFSWGLHPRLMTAWSLLATSTQFLFKWRSGRGKVNDWGQKVCESRSQGQRERRRGLIFFHFTLIGMGGISVYSIYPFLSYWSMVCHEMFARRIIHGEDKIPTWSTRSSLIKALQPTQQNKQRVLLEWNEIWCRLYSLFGNRHWDWMAHTLPYITDYGTLFKGNLHCLPCNLMEQAFSLA